VSDVSTWANLAAGNTGSVPDFLSENCPPSAVNDAFRELQAAIRRYAESAQWFDWGLTHTRLTSSSFSVSGDYRTLYEVGRRVKLTGSADAYATVSAVSYSAPNTTVTVLENNVPGTLSTVSVSILTPSNGGFPGVINNGPIDFAGGAVRVTSGDSPTTGAGTELLYSASVGYVIAYDRSGASYMPMLLSGGTFTGLQINGVTGLTLTESAGVVTLNLPANGTATVATGGAAVALPSQPLGYLKATINSTPVRIPYYAA
jgi:hypothetical protein